MVQVNNQTKLFLRFKFRKGGNLQYVSHLDLVRTMHKVIVRSKLPLWYTEGFNPKPKMVFAAPLSTGTESVAEYMDLRLSEKIDPKEAMRRLNLNLTEDMSFGINDFHYFKDAYGGAIFARYFIPFGTSKRFAMFSELRATGGYAQSETYKLTELDKHGTYQDIYDFEIGVVPGLCAFVTNSIALEVAIGLVGLNYQKVVQKTNQVGTSIMESSGANFRINLLDISLGISFYIPTGDKK